jgi:hypothetical protein
MTLSRRTKAVIWGLSVGALFTGGWFWLSHSGEQGEPMLMPGQFRSTVMFEELKTGALIYICTAVPVALLVAFRPSTREDSP